MSLLTPVLWLIIILPLLLIAKITTKKTNVKYIIIFIVYFLLDSYTRILAPRYIKIDFLNYNWIGTILATIIALIFIFYHRKDIREELGFSTKTKKTLQFGLILFIGFLLFDFVFKLILFPKGGEFKLEPFLFQATMPGISEEIVFRGILLWLLSKAFIPSKKIKGVLFGWGFVIVTFTFAMIHGVILKENMEIKIDYVTIIYLTIITSLSLGFLRKFSGTLIVPIVGHNVVNLINFFIRLM